MSKRKRQKVEISSGSSSGPSIGRHWLSEMNDASGDECLDHDESDSGDSDHMSVCDEEDKFEQSADEEADEYAVDDEDLFLVGKDKKIQWVLEPSEKNSQKSPQEDAANFHHGPKDVASKITSEDKILDLFLDSEVYKTIVECTNIYMNTIRTKFIRERDARETNETEIRAFFGLLYLIGTYKSSIKSVHKLWDNSKGNGLESFYLTMSEKRFKFLLRTIRFDDVRDRKTRKTTDKFAAIRDIFEKINRNFSKHFVPSKYLTIGEHMLAFNGKCPFKYYNTKKSSQYGIKNFSLVDSETAYTINSEIYVGAQPDGPFKQDNSPLDSVMRLVEPVKGSNRNITITHGFSSVALGRRLLEETKLTSVGLLHKNNEEIPPQLLPNKNRIVNSSLFCYHKESTVLSYCPQKGKAVLLLSTINKDDPKNENSDELQMPGILSFYNWTKNVIDLLDGVINKYNVAIYTRRWPLVVFFDLLNVCAINAMCIYKCNTGKKLCRESFLENLAWEMIKPQIEVRSGMEQIRIELRRRASLLLGVPERQQEPSVLVKDATKGRCFDCGRKKNRSTRKKCVKCLKWKCNEHLKIVCINCYDSSV